MKFLLVKSSLMSCQEAHFAGGKHAFLCLAKALAAHGQEVHTFSFGDKTSVMMYLAMNGFLGSMVASKASEGVISWRDNSITHHIAFSDHQASEQLDITALSLGRKARRHCPSHARLLDHAAWAIPTSQQLRVIIDADESQTGSSDEQVSLFEAVVQRWSHRVMPMVQNVHFLPFGPSGTSVRTQHLLDAWSQAGPVICVSTFVASYLQSHGQSARLVNERLWVTPLTAFQVFGSSADISRCTDLGSQRAAELQQGNLKPVVGMLKMTPEKGAAILAACARALPNTTFLAVSGDPAAQQLQRELPNVHIMPPQADIEEALKHMTLVITPSLWLEAFGMVVVEAMLRGLPVVVSDAGERCRLRRCSPAMSW